MIHNGAPVRKLATDKEQAEACLAEAPPEDSPACLRLVVLACVASTWPSGHRPPSKPAILYLCLSRACQLFS